MTAPNLDVDNREVGQGEGTVPNQNCTFLKGGVCVSWWRNVGSQENSLVLNLLMLTVNWPQINKTLTLCWWRRLSSLL